MQNVTLYQFQLCPFCHKIRAALELKKIPYRKIEVSPGNKKELPLLPPEAPKKVPVLQIDDELIWDSTSILLCIDERLSSTIKLNGDDQQENWEQIVALEDWIDENLIPALPTVIYASWKDAFRAARITAVESKFSLLQTINVKIFGSIIMRLIAKRILKRHHRTDGASWVRECFDYLETQLGQQQFLTGSTVSIADAAFHGALCCVEEFPVFQEAMQRSIIKNWFERVSNLRHRY